MAFPLSLMMALVPEQARLTGSPGGAVAGGMPDEPVVLDPLQDPAAWDALLANHPQASFFHTAAWARVLHETYGHKPFYFCRRGAGGMLELLPVMEVDSRWTGRRGVSLPFTDNCPALSAGVTHGAGRLHEAAVALGRQRGWKYLETRGEGVRPGTRASVTYYGHALDLSRGPERLYAALHHSIRRGVRKAERAGLKIERSATLEAMRAFYALHCLTRRRHGVPPQPFSFFESIVRHVFATGRGCIFSARQASGVVVAAAVFFQHRGRAIYKFGAFDRRFQALRPNNLLMWEAIKWHAQNGHATLHLGRTSPSASGLRRFKLEFGAREERIDYFRFHFTRNRFVPAVDHAESWVTPVFRCVPLPLLRWLGRMIYPHSS
ncbi:MAG TPA: GNAT family N-acetyltransferase [Verrucomicrobiae bacterium]|nr:GNAT family N-acetyltransferase [Verrucomicrobiae bacterium]